MQGLIGRTIGGYRIVSQIGKGGMATVFKAYQPSLDRYVALKIMPPYYAEQDDTFLKRFRQEAKAIAALRHPNILVVIDYGEEEETTYIVMEFVEAGTLTELLGKPIAPTQMSGLVGQVAGALDYAHMEGIVHRDIKPSNILLPKPDWPLLTDFGLAKIVGGSQLTQSGTIAGTPAYMSPEQGRGEKVDSRSDIYSMGVVLYEMATGVVPFHAETPMAVVVKHIIDPLPMPRSKNPDLPEQIERIILKSLAKDPADRYQTAAELGKALDSATASLPTAVAEAAPTPTAGQQTTLAAAGAIEPAIAAADQEPPPPSAQKAVLPADEKSGLLAGRGRIIVAGAGIFLLAVTAIGVVGLLTDQGETPELASIEEISPADSGGESSDGEPAAERDPAWITIGELQAALEQDPENVDLYNELGGAYVAAGEDQLALQAIRAGIDVFPEEAWVHENAGYAMHELGFWLEAADAFRTALELDPESVWNYFSMADSLISAGEHENAYAALTAARRNPIVASDPDELQSLGFYLLDLERVEEAEEAFKRAIELAPDDPDMFEGLADVAFRQGDLEGALDALDAGIRRFPEHAPFYEYAGWLLWEIGELDQAAASFEKSIELDPLNNTAYSGLASVLVDSGREQEAEEVMLRGLEEHPDEPGFYSDLAGFYTGLDRHSDAIPLYEWLLDNEPDDPWNYAYLASVYITLGENDRARGLLEESAARNFGDPWLHEFLGWMHLDLGDCGTAIEHFEQSVAIDPSIDSAYQGLEECGA